MDLRRTQRWSAGLAFGVFALELVTGAHAATAGWSAMLAGTMPWYRRAPGAAIGAALAGAAAIALQGAFISDTLLAGEGFALLVIPAATVFFLAREVGGVPAIVAGAAVTIAALFAGLTAEPDSLVPVVMPIAMAAIAGSAVRSRDLVARQLSERAAELEAERETYAELSVRYERARIAAELHDIVAHAISLMVVQAGAGQRLADVDPDAAAEAFKHIGDAARQAQDDMERLIGLLADDREDGSPPDLALVGELVRRAQGSGLAVTLRLEGERAGYPAEIARSAYLVVREGLTNALRYAAGAEVEVLVAGAAAGLRVEVRNGPATGGDVHVDLGGGTGVAGLRERLGRIGGRLDAGPSSDGGWLLSAELPRAVATIH
ncbi:MAG: hypothetical protein J7513_08925 [Solirubrobacteraceae bacterium]|nr:hypothetical protein [Solirubrobacteraceae bacterium]